MAGNMLPAISFFGRLSSLACKFFLSGSLDALLQLLINIIDPLRYYLNLSGSAGQPIPFLLIYLSRLYLLYNNRHGNGF